MNIFRKIKIEVEHAIERAYWYGWRRPAFFRYDEDEKKYYQDKRRARDVLTRTWEGDLDMLDALDLKVCHLFHNLKKYGHEVWYYVDSGACVESEKALDWAFRKLAHLALEKKEPVSCFLFENKKKEGKIVVTIRKDDESSRCWYLVLNTIFDKYTVLDAENKERIVEGKNAAETLFNAILLAHDGDYEKAKNYAKVLVSYQQSFYIDVEDIKSLPQSLKDAARGPRRHLHEIAQVHHLIKKIKEHDEKSWNVDMSSWQEYLEERKVLYHRLAEIMATRGSYWWD